MKLLNILLLLILSFNAFAQRQIIGEEIVNSSTGVKIINVPAAALSSGVLSIDGSGNLSTASPVIDNPTALTSLAQASWASGDLFKIWDLDAGSVKKTSVADFDGRYVLQSNFNTLFDSQLATKDTDDLDEGATNLYFTNGRAQTAVITQVITNGVTDKSPSEDAVFDALALKQDSISGSVNTFAGFDGSGDLYSVPEWEITSYLNGVYSNTTTDDSSNTGVQRLYFQQQLGDGIAGDADSYSAAYFNTNIQAAYDLDSYRGVKEDLTIDATATVDDYIGFDAYLSGNILNNGHSIYLNHQGDSGNNFSGIGINDNGDTTGLYQGIRIDKAGDAGSLYGVSFVNQADIVGQSELLNLSNNGSIGTNLIGSNFSNSGAVADNFSGYNVSNTGTADSFTGFSAYNDEALTNGYTGVSLTNTSNGDTDNILGFNFSSSGDGTNLSAFNFSNNGVVSGNIKGLDVQDSSNSPAANMLGGNISLTGTYDSVVGMAINVSAATDDGGDRKAGLTVEGGSLSVVVPFTTTSSLPTVVDAGNQFITQFSVNSGSPITDTSVIANNMSGLALFSDDYSADPFYGLGYAMVGFVGQLSVANTKTVDKVSMGLAGGTVPVSSTGGTIEELMMFNARGLLPAGGSISVDELFGFRVETGACTLATDCYGLSVEDTSADNFLGKSLQIGGTKAPLDADTALKIGSKKAIGFTPMTNAEISAIGSPYESQLVYSSTDQEFKYYNGSSFTSIGGTPYVEPIVSLQSANFTAAFNHIYITTNAIDVQLPAPVANKQITIKISDGSSINILPDGAEEIEGVAGTYVLTSSLQSVTLVTDGTNWFII